MYFLHLEIRCQFKDNKFNPWLFFSTSVSSPQCYYLQTCFANGKKEGKCMKVHYLSVISVTLLNEVLGLQSVSLDVMEHCSWLMTVSVLCLLWTPSFFSILAQRGWLPTLTRVKEMPWICLNQMCTLAKLLTQHKGKTMEMINTFDSSTFIASYLLLYIQTDECNMSIFIKDTAQLYK